MLVIYEGFLASYRLYLPQRSIFVDQNFQEYALIFNWK